MILRISEVSRGSPNTVQFVPNTLIVVDESKKKYNNQLHRFIYAKPKTEKIYNKAYVNVLFRKCSMLHPIYSVS